MSGILNLVSRLAIPAAVGVSLFQLSIYDVKGGSRAVIFDRISGVKETVCFSSSLPKHYSSVCG
jgi:prohibitin 1